MNIINEMLTNRILCSAILGWFLAQLVKVVIEGVMDRTFSFKRFVSGNGGMPSSHSATVCALATSALLIYGVGSFEFAISTIFALVVMIDASGVRRETGKQAVVINEMINYFKGLRPGVKKPDFSQAEFLKELVGHTPLQVFVGAALGIVLSVIMHFYWPY